MTDVIERLRAANPIPDCPPPPIQDVWRRVELDERAPLSRGVSGRGLSSARRPSFGGVMSTAAAMAALVVAVAAIVLLGHGRTGAIAPSGGGSPALAGLHAQAGRLLGPPLSINSRVRALHGLPIVINAWASWCQPCRAEFGRFAAAAARDGHQVAFLGADIDDTRTDAQAFLARHPVPYPSYQTTKRQLGSILPADDGLKGLPTTIFIDRTGRIVHVHLGEYDSTSALERDIATYLQQSKAPAGQTSSVRALVSELGILRQPQTAQARAFNISQRERRKAGQPLTPPEQLLPGLTRFVDLPDGGKLFLYVAPLASQVYGLGYHETYPGSDGGGCCMAASTLRGPHGPGPDQFASGADRHTMYFEIVPDGVARVRWVFPRDPIERSTSAPRHPTQFAKTLTVSVVVHDNIAAVRLPQRGLATSDAWYGADGHVLATYAVDYSVVHDCLANGRLTHAYTPSQLRRALETMPIEVKEYTGCWNTIKRALALATKPNSGPNSNQSASSSSS